MPENTAMTPAPRSEHPSDQSYRGRRRRNTPLTSLCARLLRLPGLLLALALPACAAAPQIVFPDKQWQTSSAEAQGVNAELLEKAMQRIADISGKDGNRQTVLIRNGYVIWQGDQVNVKHHIWSCSKSFTSVCFGVAWDRGLLSPDDLASDHLPWLNEHYPTITLQQLITFTSGYGHEEKEAFKPTAPRYKPGAFFNYSNESQVLGAIIAKRFGKTLLEVFRENIGDPIGIDRQVMSWRSLNTTVEGIEALYGGQGVEIDALNLARFGWLMANDGVWNGKRLLSRRYVRQATRPNLARDIPPFKADAWYVNLPGNYGMHWWTNGPRPNGTPHWPSAPPGTFAAQGLHNNNCFVIPEWQMVLVRMGEDNLKDGMEKWDEVFAFLAQALGKTPATKP